MSFSESKTVMLKSQTNRGGYLHIDENGVVTIADELPTDRNPRKNTTKINTWEYIFILTTIACA